MEQGPYGYVVYKNPELTDTVRVTMPSEYGGLTFDNMPTEIYNEISTAAFKTLLDNDPKLGRQFLDLVKTGDVDRYLQSKISSEVIDYFANRRLVVPAPIPSNKKGGILKAQSGRVVNLGYKPEETTLSRADEINERFTNPFAPQHIRKDGESQFWEGMSKTDG